MAQLVFSFAVLDLAPEMMTAAMQGYQARVAREGHEGQAGVAGDLFGQAVHAVPEEASEVEKRSHAGWSGGLDRKPHYMGALLERDCLIRNSMYSLEPTRPPAA